MSDQEKVLLMKVDDAFNLSIFVENLKSNAVIFEVRNDNEIYVVPDELEIAKSIIEQGQWDY